MLLYYDVFMPITLTIGHNNSREASLISIPNLICTYLNKMAETLNCVILFIYAFMVNSAIAFWRRPIFSLIATCLVCFL